MESSIIEYSRELKLKKGRSECSYGCQTEAFNYLSLILASWQNEEGEGWSETITEVLASYT